MMSTRKQRVKEQEIAMNMNQINPTNVEQLSPV